MQIGPAQHQLARIDMPTDQRQERDPQPQRLHVDRKSAGRLPPTLTCAAVSIGCGSSVSEIGPSMVTGWPSVAVASASIVER